MKKFMLLLVILLLAITHVAANSISGDVVADTTWTGVVDVVGNVTVKPDVKLTIEPGTTVKFSGNHVITIEGIIHAAGTPEGKIVFTSGQATPAPGNWVGVRFTDTSGYPEDHAISHWEVRYATIGLNFIDTKGIERIPLNHVSVDQCSDIAVRVENGAVALNNCTVKNFGNHGVFAIGSNTDLLVQDSEVEQLVPARVYTANGIYGLNGALVTLTGNAIKGCNMGVHAHTRHNEPGPDFMITNNTITANKIGIQTSGVHTSVLFPTVTASANDIHANQNWNVNIGVGANPGNTVLDFTNNWWGTTDGVAIAAAIYHYTNATSRAFVDFLPFLDGSYKDPGESTSGNYVVNWVDQNTTWSGEVIVLGEIIVKPEITLSIAPGTVVKFAGNYAISVDGILSAAGTAEDKIVFTSLHANPSPGNWSGISFSSQSGYPENHSITHCEIHYATVALRFNGALGQENIPVSHTLIDNTHDIAVRVDNSRVMLDNCAVKNFRNHGIYATGVNTVLEIRDSEVVQLVPDRVGTANGIYGMNGVGVAMSGTTIRGCSNGIYAVNTGTRPVFRLTDNKLTDNNIGVNITARSGPTDYPYPDIVANQNDIYSNTSWNLYVNRGRDPKTTELDFTSNWWGSADGVEIAKNIYDYTNNQLVAFANFLPFLDASISSGGNPTSGNFVAGWIFDDTTWAPVNSPYIVPKNIIVAAGKTLTVEAGVEVRFEDCQLIIEGNLLANGTSSSQVHFTSNQGVPQAGDWRGITLVPAAKSGEPLQMSNCIIDWAATGVLVNNSHAVINDVVVRNFSIAGLHASGSGAMMEVTNSVITQTNSATIGNGDGIFGTMGAKVTLSGNTISKCNTGVRPFTSSSGSPPDFSLDNNTISENVHGIFLSTSSGGRPYPFISASYNDIQSNSIWNFNISFGANPRQTLIDLTNNWWGTTDGVEVASGILDYTNNTSMAFVDYVPFLDNSFSEGGNPIKGNYISGWITEDTSWKVEGSPYILPKTVLVAQGKTLTIEEGVEVRFEDAQLLAEGTVLAKGTATHRVLFRSNRQAPQAGDWRGIFIEYQSGSFEPSVFSYCIIEMAHTGLRFQNCEAYVTNTLIRNFSNTGLYVTGAGANVSMNNAVVTQTLSGTINTGNGVFGGSGAQLNLQGNIISRCNYGVYASNHLSPYIPPAFHMTKNSILGNNRGVYIFARVGSYYYTYPDLTVNQNDIHTNAAWNVYADRGASPASTEFDFTDNFWNLPDSASIKTKIYDYHNNTSCGKVLFVPFAAVHQGHYGISDINKDGRTDGLDLAVLAASFGLYDHEPGFNPAADINSSGRVDGFDLAILGINFGVWGPGHVKKSGPGLDDDQEMHIVADAMYTSLNRGDTVKYIFSASQAEDLYALAVSAGYDSNAMRFVGASDGGLLSGDGRRQVVTLFRRKPEAVYAAISRVGPPQEANRSDGDAMVFTFVLLSDHTGVPGLTWQGVEAISDDGYSTLPFGFSNNLVTGIMTHLDSQVTPVMIYPNPVRGNGTVEFQLGETSVVDISIYSINGLKIATLVNGPMHAGTHVVTMQASALRPGVYICVMKQNTKTWHLRFVVQH